MASPVRRGVESVVKFLLNRVIKVIAWPIRRRLARFEAATHRPREVQQALLNDILAYQADTAFGRDHHFTSITSVEDFRNNVAVAGYDQVEPYMARVRKGEIRALLADSKVHMFALTSGTTASRKFIPVTPRYLADYRRGWNIWGLKVFRDHPGVKLRPIVQWSGDWDEFRTESGVPCGAVTGLTATMQKRIIRWLYCVPGCVGRVKDAAAKYYLALRLSVPRKVALIIAANPSTVIQLARAGDQDKEDLIRDIHDGTLSRRFEIPEDVRAEVQRRLKQDPRRAAELDAIVEKTGHLYPRDYWAGECLLGNWTGGSVGAYMRHYPRYFGDRIVRDVGLIASEGRMTIPFADNSSAGVLDITSHYFEFIPEAEIDSPQPTVLGAHELREGGTYYILPTTFYGLYRYDIRDLVRCTGFFNQTPLIEFLGKGSYIANLTGEKLSEYHVTQSMTAALRELDVSLNAYSVAPCWDDELPYYGLFVEATDVAADGVGERLTRRLDERLREMNIEYAAKRDSLRLGPVRLQLMRPGAWAEWDRERLRETGGTMEQYKRPCLINDLSFRDRMLDRTPVAVSGS